MGLSFRLGKNFENKFHIRTIILGSTTYGNDGVGLFMVETMQQESNY